MTLIKLKDLEAHLWHAAHIITGPIDASDYKTYIFPILFFKRICDVYDEEFQEAMEQVGDEELAKGEMFHRIQIPENCHWRHVFNRTKDVGQSLKEAFRGIELANPKLHGIFGDASWTNKERLSDELLATLLNHFNKINLGVASVRDDDMGRAYEYLIKRFADKANKKAGEFYTPRTIVRLMVNILDPQAGESVYDPACGTGGMLALTEEAMIAHNEKIRVELYGQELNGESFGICKSDMLVTGHNPEQIAYGNTLTEDAHKDKKFHYMLSNPPYGVDWKKYKDPIIDEAKEMGADGRFGAGLPRVSDGQLLFLQHMIAKMRDDEAGSRIGIVMNGSPLFTGSANSGESEIRRWMLENDWVEAIIALPTDLFYNTGIQTYVWMLTNRKQDQRLGKVQLIDASGERFWNSMRKSLGSKRREISDDARNEIVKMYSQMLNGNSGWGEYSKIFDVADFAYREVRVERPLKLNFQFTAERLESILQ